MPAHGPIQSRASFQKLRYASCWEDAAVVAEALDPLEGTRCLSIASAGDNTLSLLARGAGEVWAVDVSPAQLALVELKMAAFRHLEHPEVLGFLGVRPSATRRAVYESLRGALAAGARAFWDERRHLQSHRRIGGGQDDGLGPRLPPRRGGGHHVLTRINRDGHPPARLGNVHVATHDGEPGHPSVRADVDHQLRNHGLELLGPCLRKFGPFVPTGMSTRGRGGLKRRPGACQLSVLLEAVPEPQQGIEARIELLALL